MFVERLTEEQVKDFLDEQYHKFTFGYKFERNKSDKSFFGTVEVLYNSSQWESFYLWDFGGETSRFSFSINVDWIRYLYKIFGEEYKEAYLEYHTKIFK